MVGAVPGDRVGVRGGPDRHRERVRSCADQGAGNSGVIVLSGAGSLPDWVVRQIAVAASATLRAKALETGWQRSSGSGIGFRTRGSFTSLRVSPDASYPSSGGTGWTEFVWAFGVGAVLGAGFATICRRSGPWASDRVGALEFSFVARLPTGSTRNGKAHFCQSGPVSPVAAVGEPPAAIFMFHP